MTEPTNRTHRVPPSETPRKKPASRGGLGLAWKSGILAASLGVVMLGWSALAQAENATSSQAATPVRQPVAAQVQPAAAQAPVQISQLPSAQVARTQRIVVPSRPARPVFVRPITRTRAS